MKYVISKNYRKKCEIDENQDQSEEFANPGIGIRHLQSLLLALCIFCSYLQRVNLSVTIVAMTKTTKNNGTRDSFPVFEWNNDICSYLHSAFFIGYLFMNFPAAIVGVHISNKILLFLSLSINSILTCITPFLICFEYTGSNDFLKNLKELAGEGNWRAFVILRAIQGLLQAFVFPTVHAISAKWTPPNERSRLTGFIFNGQPFGTMVTLAGSGILASSPLLGWPSVFYVSGATGIIWVLFWAWFGANNPFKHRRISSKERNYICSSLPLERKSRKSIPWCDILLSSQVWAVVVAHTSHSWGLWLLISQMPTFLHSVAVMTYILNKDGLISSLPYLSTWCVQFPVMWMADKFNEKRITSLTTSRKLWNSIGLWGKAICLLVLGYYNNDKIIVLILYIFAVSIEACSNVGFHINHMDLSPNYAGLLMGLSNAFAATGGFGSPLIVAYLVHDITSVHQWQSVFYVGAGILFFGNLFYIIFGSGKIQSWNNSVK